MNRMEEQEYYNNIITSIKHQIEDDMNKAYTEYKEACLEQLNREMEVRRNNIVGDAINGVSIAMANGDMYLNEPIIRIEIKKNVYLKEGRD